MAAETFEIRVVLDPVSYSNACFECTFESIESAVAFAEQCEITCSIIEHQWVIGGEFHRLLAPSFRTLLVSQPVDRVSSETVRT